jgi:predicted DNA-binding transcriptional regulator YafY
MNTDNDRKRISRLTSIITQLQTKRLLTATQLSDKFPVSVRTIYRDIRALEEAGVPIITEEGKGYSIMEHYRLPPVMFTESEANALITAEQLVLKNKDASFIKDYEKQGRFFYKRLYRSRCQNKSSIKTHFERQSKFTF